MSWIVEFADEFVTEFLVLEPPVRIELAANAELLKQFGPQLGRPRVDTLNGSRYANMKELRFMVDGQAWRVAFAFDPRRRAILLCAGSKSGKNQGRFYRTLIRKADSRLDTHLKRLSIDSEDQD